MAREHRSLIRLGAEARRLLHGTGLQILARLATAATTFATLALAARQLDTSRFGVLTYYLLLWAILEVLLDMGSMTTSLRLAAASASAEGASIRRMRALRAALLGPCLLAVLASVALFREREAAWILLASTSLAAQLLSPRTVLLHRDIRFREIAAARVAGGLLTLACVAALFAAGVHREGPVLCAFALGTTCTAALCYRAAPRPAAPAAPIAWRAYLGEAVPLGLGALARALYFWMDGIFVRAYRDAHEVALYNSAYRIFNLSILLATHLSATALPLLARACAEDPARARRLVAKLLAALGLIGLPLAGALALFAEPALTLAFGADYAPAAPVLATLAIASAAIHLAAVLLTALTARAAARAVAGISLLALALNALLNFWWVPAQGALGAARATACTEVAVLLLALFLHWRGSRTRGESRP